jgi:hypothetical protein
MKTFFCYLILSFTIFICLFPSYTFSKITKKEYFIYSKKMSKDSCDNLIDFFSKEIKINPNNSEYYNKRAQCYYEKGEFDKAIIDNSKSISLSEKKEYLYNRAITVLKLFVIGGKVDKSLAKSALVDLQKVMAIDPEFEHDNVKKYIKELNKIASKIELKKTVNYERLSGSLYAFYLRNGSALYIIFPPNLSTATFNIIKQHPTNKGDNSSKFLLFRGTFEKFLESLVSCIDIVQRDGELFIMTIDDEIQGLQEGMLYGTDIRYLHNPDPHYLWVPEPINKACNATGLLKFDEIKQIDDVPEDCILHDGTLKIRVLNAKDKKPVTIIESTISCSKIQGNVPYNSGVDEFVTEIIPACKVTYINVKLVLENDTRWLLDRTRETKMMNDYVLEINGKSFPNNFDYVIENEQYNTINFVVHLKRITK